MVSNGQTHNPMLWAPRRFPTVMASPYYGLLPPGAPATYQSAPGALTCGKFPNPKSVIPYLGNNKEAQMFLSRGAQVIIRMRGLPYNASPKEVVSTFPFSKGSLVHPGKKGRLSTVELLIRVACFVKKVNNI